MLLAIHFIFIYLMHFVISIDGWLNVEWDTGSVRMYRYGSTNTEKDKFDVQVCDNPRILQNELIATGCLVTRGIIK